MDPQHAIGAKRTYDMEIRTLGTFVIRSGEMPISEKTKRSKKIWELFKYLLTNEGRSVPAETIIDSLWPEQENVGPRAALQDLVYRTRRLFRDQSSSGESSVRIEFALGGYCLTLGRGCWFDARELVRKCQEAASLVKSDPAEAIARYREAATLYGGDYLPEHPYKSWILPTRQYYRRMFIRGLRQLVELLRASGEHAEIVRVCEETFAVGPLLEAEDVHHCFMQALAEEGRTVEALAHYRFFNELLNRELDVRPSSCLRDLRRLLKADMGSD